MGECWCDFRHGIALSCLWVLFFEVVNGSMKLVNFSRIGVVCCSVDQNCTQVRLQGYGERIEDLVAKLVVRGHHRFPLAIATRIFSTLLLHLIFGLSNWSMKIRGKDNFGSGCTHNRIGERDSTGELDVLIIQ